MPKRRLTRNKSKRPGPTMPDGDEGANIDVESRKEKVKTLIKDFENEVQARLDALELMGKNMASQIDLAYTMEMMQIPPEIRNMKLTDFLAADGAFEVKQYPVSSEVDNAVSSVLNAQSDDGPSTSGNIPSASGNGSSTSGRQLEAVEEEETVLTTTARQTRPRGKKAKATAQQGRSRQKTEEMTSMQTPACNTTSEMAMMTPLITPKFDPRLYQTSAVTKRVAKPDDVLMSVEGSPVINQNSNSFLLPVGKSEAIAFQDVSELSNLDSNTAKVAMLSLEQMQRQLSAVINFNKTTAK